MLQHRSQQIESEERPPQTPLKGSIHTVNETRTGVSVPVERSVAVPGRFGLIPEGAPAQSEEVGPGDTLRLRLLGVGPRLYPLVGGLVKVSVYALGLYAEETQAVEKLRALEPGLSAALASHKGGHHLPPEYYETLLRPEPWPRALYMHFARNVATYRILEAFKPYPKLAGRIWEGFKETFDHYFGAEGIKTGDVIAFVWVKDGLLTDINGKVASFLPEPDLAREVFRVYLGDPPVSQDAKERLASEVPTVLKAHAPKAAAAAAETGK